MASQLKDGQATALQLFPEVSSPFELPSQGRPRKKGRAPKKERNKAPAGPASLLSPTATPAQIEGILQACLDKGIDLEVIYEQWQVRDLEDLEEDQVQQVQEWLQSQ